MKPPGLIDVLILCEGYRLTMKPWRCIENQLSDYCMEGWPCLDCETGVGLAIAHAKMPKCKAGWDRKTMSRSVARDLGLI